MSENLTIVNHDLTIKEYKGQRVITFKDIDIVHERPNGTAKDRFNNNKKRFAENEDYFIAKPSDMQKYEIYTFEIKSPRGLILITESGYLMLVKSFTNDLAWKVQRQLVNTYFRAKENLPVPQPNQITALRLIADQLEMQSKRFDKIEQRLEIVENRPQTDESTAKRLDKLETKYNACSNIHFKPQKAKKYNVLDELLIAFQNRSDERLCILTGNKKYDENLITVLKDCIEEMRDMQLKTIYQIGKQFGQKNDERRRYYWNNNSYKGFYNRDYILTKLCYAFEQTYRCGHSINSREVSAI